MKKNLIIIKEKRKQVITFAQLTVFSFYPLRSVVWHEY